MAVLTRMNDWALRQLQPFSSGHWINPCPHDDDAVLSFRKWICLGIAIGIAMERKWVELDADTWFRLAHAGSTALKALDRAAGTEER